MMVELSTHETASGRAERAIRDWIGREVYGAGKRLPSERELAGRIGVSRTTIRSVLENLEDDGLVESDEAGRKVVTARAVTNERSVMSHTVAVLASSSKGPGLHSGRTTGWEDFVYQGVMRGLEQKELHGLTMRASRVVEEGRDYLLGQRPRGVIALKEFAQSDSGPQTLLRLKEAGVPVAIYADHGVIPELDLVASDHRKGCYELTRWLLDRGCRRILPLWPPQANGERRWLKQRAAGYREALRDAGEEPIPALSVPGVAALRQQVDDMEEQFVVRSRLYAGYLADRLSGQNRVDALMAASDGHVPALCAACRLLGKEPQQDVLVVGYDNYWEDVPEREFESIPPAATVDKQNLQIGESLARLVEERATGELPREPQKRMVEPELVVMDR
jgi:DNA-binding LacI/PurR family transcriptional regulator